MKYFLFCLMVAAGHLQADEIVTQTFDRVRGSVDHEEMTVLLPRAEVPAGRLSMAFWPQIVSIMPYDAEYGRRLDRPQVLDLLFYEPLMAQDPRGPSDTYFPLIARQLILDTDYRYVEFEIDPLARFQDGTPVQPDDLVFSILVHVQHEPSARKTWEACQSGTELHSQRLRVYNRCPAQMARNLIALIAETRIVKPNRGSYPPELAGIPIPFIGTGPYKLSRLSPVRLLLERRPGYWGARLPMRSGFFNFREVEIIARATEADARSLLSSTLINYYQEAIPGQPRAFLNGAFRITEEKNRLSDDFLHSFAFDLRRPLLRDPKVRQALILAFDFDRINLQGFEGDLRRPSTLLEDGRTVPAGRATPPVADLIRSCGAAYEADATADISQSGNSIYRVKYTERKSRLLAAQALFKLAGFEVDASGHLSYFDEQGQRLPFRLDVLVRNEAEERMAYQFRADLQDIGIELAITRTSNEVYERLADSGTFDLISARFTLLSPSGLPAVPNQRDFKLISGGGEEPCVRRLLDELAGTDPQHPQFSRLAEAIARVHQTRFLNIFLGEPRTNRFFHDPALQVPRGFSMELLPYIGFWLTSPP